MDKDDDASAAFALAQRLVQQAVRERWDYVSLSPLLNGVGESRQAFEIFKNLTCLPEEVRNLPSGVQIELRATQITDLRPLAHIENIGLVNFSGIPAVDDDEELQRISSLVNVELKIERLRLWLQDNKVSDPPEEKVGGPRFIVGDEAPVRLVDENLGKSDDDDQKELQDECKIKSSELQNISELAANVAPDLPKIVDRYINLIEREPNKIGARHIWSIANSLEAVFEVHQRALENDRQSEELPSTVAAKLNDLLETHRVWFLGHPGARLVEDRAVKHKRPEAHNERRLAAIAIVEAAEASSDVDNKATALARENIETSRLDTPAGVAAYGELEDWAWNFVASVTRKAWSIAKNPPGGFMMQTISGHYLIMFIVNNDVVIGHYISTVMSQGPLWWETLCNSLRRLSLAEKPKQEQR